MDATSIPMMAATEKNPCSECGSPRTTLMVSKTRRDGKPSFTWEAGTSHKPDTRPFPVSLIVTCCASCDSTTYFASHEGCDQQDKHVHGVTWTREE